MSEIAISLKNISKCYKRYAQPVDRLKEIFLPGDGYAQEFWALRDIDLEVAQGETLGLIGQNGSGKSTLLQIVAGTLATTTGEVWVNGRVSALLELGSGFNPEFTGRENIFFNGQILGLSREEIASKYDEITAFAEIGDFIEQPVKTYSSGMVVRLAFAVLANLEPSILIIDEALAVGDAKFQARCMKRIHQLRDQGVTILFVSHDSSSIKMLCERAVLMNQGKILETGNPKDVVNHYIALLGSDNSEFDLATRNKQPSHSIDNSTNYVDDSERLESYRHGNQIALLKDVRVLDSDNQDATKLQTGSNLQIVSSVEAKANLSDLVVGISIRNLMGLVIYGTNTFLVNSQSIKLDNNQQVTVTFQVPCCFNRGVYTLTVGVHSIEGTSYDWIDELVAFEVINGNSCEGVVDVQSSVNIQYPSYVAS